MFKVNIMLLKVLLFFIAFLVGADELMLGPLLTPIGRELGVQPERVTLFITAYSLALALIALTGTPMVAPPDARYLWAMLYLAVVGSVIGFTTYLMLVARIGSARAAYATVLFPIVALALSTTYEGYAWHWQGVLGLGLALLGNVAMFSRPRTGRVQPA